MSSAGSSQGPWSRNGEKLSQGNEKGTGGAPSPPESHVPLTKDSDFLKFWAGDTITQFTGQISGLALPTVAVVALGVTGFQLGVIEALGFVAFPILGLFVGVWMDRTKRRPVLIVMDLLQVATLATVPAAFILGLLGVYQLYVVALIMGTTTLFFDVAYQSYLPSLVRRDEVVEGNQKLQISASAATVIGPSVASAMMFLLGSAQAVAADVLGTFAAALLLLSIRKREPAPEAVPGAGRHFFAEMKEGIHVITSNKLLWTQAGCTGTSNLGSNMVNVAIFLYAYRVLGITPATIGIAFTIGSAGFLIGALLSPRVTRRLGLGKAIALSISGNFGMLIVLLASGTWAVFVVGLGFFVSFTGVPIYNINQVSLRQIITPNRLQGRMNATMRTIVWGTIPAGSLIGGITVVGWGLVPTIVVGTIISGSAVLWILLGPIFRLKVQPQPAKE